MSNENHAKSNAAAWLATIVAGMAALTALDAGAETAEHEGETFESADELRERLQEGPLSVQVRSDWHTPGEEGVKPSEFMILLSTGGPALRIIGDLGHWGEAEAAKLQYQDWGTPWTDHDLTSNERAALLNYCGLFYFGDG